jgi:SOS-response transcriptional repressor LexA
MITPYQKRGYDFIAGRILSTAIPPTLREIACHLGCPSRTTAHRLVNQLIERGYLRRPLGAGHHANLELGDRVPPAPAARVQYFRFDDETKQLVEWQP